MNQRAITYRRLHDIPESWGTAVNVQAMVFGNMGETLGDRRRLHAQSVDRREGALRRIPHQRAGRGRRRRHPHAAGDHRSRAQGGAAPTSRRWRRRCRRPIAELTRIYNMLEKHYRDMQDLEFTVEQGKLWMLQTRTGKRTAQGRAAHRGRAGERRTDHEGRGGAARRARWRSISCCTRPSIPTRAPQDDRDRPAGLARRGHRRDRVHLRRSGGAREPAARKVILVRVETSPEDIHGMHAAEAS